MRTRQQAREVVHLHLREVRRRVRAIEQICDEDGDGKWVGTDEEVSEAVAVGVRLAGLAHGIRIGGGRRIAS